MISNLINMLRATKGVVDLATSDKPEFVQARAELTAAKEDFKKRPVENIGRWAGNAVMFVFVVFVLAVVLIGALQNHETPRPNVAENQRLLREAQERDKREHELLFRWLHRSDACKEMFPENDYSLLKLQMEAGEMSIQPPFKRQLWVEHTECRPENFPKE